MSNKIDVAKAVEDLVPAPKYRGSLTANTKQAYDAIVWNDTRPKPSWSQVTGKFKPDLRKRLRYVVNTKTDKLIGKGFMYKGVKFSLDLHDQINWIGLHAIRGTLTYPFKIKGAEADVYYTIQDSTDMESFYNTGIQAVLANIQSGWLLKDSLKTMTLQQLKDFIDPRNTG